MCLHVQGSTVNTIVLIVRMRVDSDARGRLSAELSRMHSELGDSTQRLHSSDRTQRLYSATVLADTTRRLHSLYTAPVQRAPMQSERASSNTQAPHIIWSGRVCKSRQESRRVPHNA